MSYYESERAVQDYVLFHYGDYEQTVPFEGVPKGHEYLKRCVSEGVKGFEWGEEARALDVGCAVGRASFELARYAREVVGIDLSQRFIETAKIMQRDGHIACERLEEGARTAVCEVVVPPEIDRARVRFEVGDALQLPEELGQFDVVLAVNLVDRLPAPGRFLDRCKTLVKPGGRLILASPYTWLEEYTPRVEWLGGQADNAQPTWQQIAARLEPQFALRARNDVPFLLREHARKYQWSVAELTVWQQR